MTKRKAKRPKSRKTVKKRPKPKKRGRGRPTSYRAEFCEQARRLCTLGALDRELWEFFGVSESTLNLWKLEHPEFSESLKLGKEGPDTRVEAGLYHRALGYSHPAEKILVVNGAVKRVKFTEHYPPDATSMIFWLKNRRGAVWRDMHRQELANPPGETLKTEQTYVPGSPELLESYYAKLAQAAEAARTDSAAPSDLGTRGSSREEPDEDPELGPR